MYQDACTGGPVKDLSPVVLVRGRKGAGSEKRRVGMVLGVTEALETCDQDLH